MLPSRNQAAPSTERTRVRAQTRRCAELRASNAAATPRQSHQKLIKKVCYGCPDVLESDPMLPTTLILTMFRSKTLSVIYNLHKPEFPRVRLPTQGMSELGSVVAPQDDAYATNALRQPHPRSQKCVESLVPLATFCRSWGPKDLYK